MRGTFILNPRLVCSFMGVFVGHADRSLFDLQTCSTCACPAMRQDSLPPLSTNASPFASFCRDVSMTALEGLPSHGLEALQVLMARAAFALKSLPPLGALQSLQEAHLTYPSHCCALIGWNVQKYDRFRSLCSVAHNKLGFRFHFNFH